MDTKLAPKEATTSASQPPQQAGQQPNSAPDQTATPATDLPTVNGTLTRPQSKLSDAIVRGFDQKQEQQLYSSTWWGVLHVLTTVIPTPARNDRQRVQELIQTLELLAEEQKKKHKAFDPREPIFFNQLALVIGVDRAKELVDKTQKLASGGKDPAATATLMRDIAELIEGSSLAAKYGVDAATVEKELGKEFSKRASRGVFLGESILDVISNAPPRPESPASFVVGEDLGGAVKRDPSNAISYLQTPAGLATFRERIERHKDPEAIAKTLSELRELLGTERFSTLISAYDSHFGRPLVADLVNRFEPSLELQRTTLSRLCGTESTLFTASELARVAEFIRAEHALVAETITLENERARLSLVSMEAQRAQIVERLAKFLGDEAITSLLVAEQQKTIQRKIAERFPGMREMGIPEMRKELETLASHKELPDFREHMNRLGRAPLGDLTASDYERKTQEQIQALNTERQREIQAEMQRIKSEALLISTQVEELSRSETSIQSARVSAESGVAGEREALEARHGALLRGVFPEISPERNASVRAAARANLETLDERIQRAKGPEREALCRERDSIEWASVQARVAHHLTTKPPNSTRALELLTEFQLRPGTGDVGRGEAFLQAARRLSGSIQAVETYVGEARAGSQRELIDRSAAKASARAKLDELEPEWRKARDQKDSYTISGSEYWNNIYKELGQLRARRDFGVAVPEGRIEHLENTIANAGTFDRTGASGYGDIAARFHMLEEQWQLTNQRMEKAAEQVPKLEQIATRMLDDRRERLLASIVAPQLRSGDALDQAGLERALADQGAPSQGFGSARQAYGVMMTALGNSDTTTFGSALAPRSAAISVGRSLNSSADKLPDELARVTGARDLNELGLKLHATLRHDHTLQPPREALTKLLECVGSDSPIGKQIIALRSAGRTDEIMSQLYARLSQDDATRVRLFMLSYDCPELYQFFGVPGQAAGAMKQPSKVWKFLSDLPPAEQSPDILQLISIMPQLRARRDVEALVSKVPDEQLSAALDRYKAVTGQSLGVVMLELAPRAGDARRKFLVECVAPSRVVRQSDLAPLYPGGVVPEGAQARQERMRELVSADRRQSIELDKDVLALIGSQAQERASLQAALPAMTQLQRTEKVTDIRQRLAVLDAQFVAKRDSFLQSLDPALVARAGVQSNIEEARGMATQAALIEVSDPYGELAQRASGLVDLLSDETVSADDVMNDVRKGNFSEGQMALLETFYLQQVAARTGTPLTGDLERDLRARRGGAALSPEQLRLVLRGGEALVQYDLARFTEGIRTRDPRMTVRAMIAMKTREGGQELFERSLRANRELGEAWASFRASPEGKEAAAYYDAVVTNDTVKQGVVELKQGFGTAARRTGEFFGEVRRVTGNFTEQQMREAREFYKTTYGTDFVADLKETVPSLKEAWAGVMSVVPSERAAAALAAVRSSISSTGIDFSIVRNALDLAPTPEQRRVILSELNKFAQGLPNSWNYVDGRPMSVIEYVRSNGGPMGKADAAMLERLLGAHDTQALSDRELSRYLGERRRLEFQIKQLDSLETRRLETHKHAQDFFSTVANMHSAAERDRNQRTVLGMQGPTWERADRLAQVHAGMRANQLDLLNHQRMGLADIAATRELVRLRGEMLLTDIMTGEDRGLRVEQNDRSVSALRTRDAEREWVAVRRDVVNKWRYDAEVAQKSLESLDWWVTVGYQSVKAIAIIGVSIFASPAAGFALACAWNLAEKAHKVAFNGMSLEEAGRQFLIDLAIDSVLLGFSFLRFGRFFARGGAAAEKAVKPITKWGPFIESPFKSVRGSWMTNIDDILEGIRKTPSLSGQARLLEVGKQYLENGGLNFSRWVEVGKRTIDAGTSSRLLLSLLGPTLEKPNQPPSAVTPPRDADTGGTGASGWTPSILGPTFLDDLFVGSGKKDRRQSSPPGSPPPGSPPPIIPAMEAPVNADDKPKSGDAPGPGGPALDPGNGGPNTYVLASLREAQESVDSVRNSALEELRGTREAARELQTTQENLLASLQAEQDVPPEQQRQKYTEQREALEDRVQRLEEKQRNLLEVVGKLEAEEQGAFIAGSQLPLDFEKTRTQAHAAIEEINREIAQVRENLEGLKESVATAEKQAQELVQARAEAEARREAAQQAIQNALAEGQKLWNQTQDAVAVAQEGLRNVAAQAQAALNGALNNLAQSFAEAQARQQAAEAAAQAAAQAQAEADARTRTEAQAEALRQRASDAWNFVQQTAQDLTTRVQDIKQEATQKLTEGATLVLNLVESAGQKAEEAARAQVEAQRQEDALRAGQTYDAIRAGLSQAGESANAFLHELAKMSEREEQPLPKPVSEALLATLPPEIRASLEKVPGLLSENLIQAREKIEGVINEFQRVQREQQEQIANVQREEFRERIDKMLLEGKQLGQQAYEVIKEAVSELTARKEEQEALAREARDTVRIVRDQITIVEREIRALLSDVSKPTTSPPDEERRPLQQRAEIVLVRLHEEVARLALPERLADSLHPEIKSEWNRTRQVAEINLATLRESIAVASHAGGPKSGESSAEVSTARSAEIKEVLERSLLVSEQACERTQRSIAREEARQVEEHSRSRQAIAELVTFARGSQATIQRAAEVIAQQITENDSSPSWPSNVDRKRRDSAGRGSGESGGSAPDFGPGSRPDRGGGSTAVPPRTQGATLQTTGYANSPSSPLMSQAQASRLSEGERRVNSASSEMSRPMNVPVMRDARLTPALAEKRGASQDTGALGATVSELSATSEIDVPVFKEPLLSELDAGEQEISRGAKKSKRSARELARAAEERQIIIQQLMAGILEKSKREKLLRLLIELGISEVEYRDLVAKLGEMEARHAAEQTKEEATEQALEIPFESPRSADTKPMEAPAMKVGSPKINPTTVVPITAETRAEMYARLKKMKERNSL